jgi:rod shape-determining protein MreC
VQRAVTGVVNGVQDSWQNYFALQQVRAENERLRTELAQLRVQVQQERARAVRAEELEKLLGYQRALRVDTIAAGVIGASASLDFRGITIDRGTTHTVNANMAVIAPAGLVGRVVTPTAHASKVQLMIDQNAAAGALVERTRAQGIVVGTGVEMLRMNFVPVTADVKAGDTVVTSGVDGIYPKGFVVGKVEQVDNGNGIYKNIRVRPSVEFNRLEDVLVVKTPPEQAPPGGNGS